MNVDITYQAAPTVSRFLDSDSFVRTIIGPIGSGKSSGCIMEFLRRAQEQKPGADGVRKTRWAIIRNTYRELNDTTRKTFSQWIPADLGKWNEQDFTFTMSYVAADGIPVHSEFLFRALDRPQDVKKVLSLEITGAYFNELREVPKEVFDGVQGRVGRFPAVADGGATWYGVWADSNPWDTGSWGYQLFSKERPQGFELFEQPGGRDEKAENVANLPPGYYDRLVAGKDLDWVASYVDGKYPSSDHGSIFGKWIAAAEEQGRLANFQHPTDGVYASFDLGVSDATAIWWWRLGPGGVPDVIDWYEASGEGASHYFQVLNGGTPKGCDRPRKYELSKIFLPHDARARTFQTGVSTLEQFRGEFGSLVTVGPELSVDDGIGAVRWMLERPTRIHPRCEDGVRRLRSYRFEWDEVKKTFKKTPLHDFASHSADAFRYVACVVKSVWEMTKPAEAKPAPVIGPIKLSIDDLIEQNQAPARSQRI